jgi:CRISPR-associated protein Cas2
MRILIGYDVCTLQPEGRKRLRQICQACKDYGQRVQKSLFEVQLEQRHWVELQSRLLKILVVNEDSVRFYFLDEDTMVEHHGQGKPYDLDGPLIV